MRRADASQVQFTSKATVVTFYCLCETMRAELCQSMMFTAYSLLGSAGDCTPSALHVLVHAVLTLMTPSNLHLQHPATVIPLWLQVSMSKPQGLMLSRHVRGVLVLRCHIIMGSPE